MRNSVFWTFGFSSDASCETVSSHKDQHCHDESPITARSTQLPESWDSFLNASTLCQLDPSFTFVRARGEVVMTALLLLIALTVTSKGVRITAAKFPCADASSYTSMDHGSIGGTSIIAFMMSMTSYSSIATNPRLAKDGTNTRSRLDWTLCVEAPPHQLHSLSASPRTSMNFIVSSMLLLNAGDGR